MPTICMFRGIKVYINWREHQPPHFHAVYGGQEVIVSIHEIEVIEGSMPNKQLKMLLGWAAFHQEELLENWALAEQMQELFPIEPLKQGGYLMAKDTNYYLSLGFNEPAAAYFAAGRRKIISASPNPDYTLTLKFDNGETRLYDCKPLLRPNTVFAPLADRQTFRRVYLDDQHCVSWDIDPAIDSRVVWKNKIDLSPDSCYLESEPLAG